MISKSRNPLLISVYIKRIPTSQCEGLYLEMGSQGDDS